MMKDSVRLFLALPFDEHYHTLISKFTGQQDIPKIRWITPENWHVTVLFIGDFPARHIPALINSLNDFFKKQHTFSLHFDGFVYQPKQAKPAMIWGRFRQNSYFDLLCRQLADHIESLFFDLSLLFNMSIHSENIPHITLSRLKSILVRYPDLNIKGIDTHQPILRCDFCTLYQSVLSSEGAKYSKLAEFKLNQL
jgi:2'-5' RNA ligase